MDSDEVIKARTLAEGINNASMVEPKIFDEFDLIMGKKENRNKIEFASLNFGVGPLAVYEIILDREMDMREKQVVGALLKAFYKSTYAFRRKATTYKFHGKNKSIRSFILIPK